MNKTSMIKRRLWLAPVALLAMLVAPAAMAGNLGFSLNLFGPGYSIGYSGCSHCRGSGYVSAYVGSGWGGYYAPAPVYYAPSSVYYEPAPVYYSRVVYREPVRRVYGSYYADDGWRGRAYRGRDDGYDRRGGDWRRDSYRDGDRRGYYRDDRGPRNVPVRGGGDRDRGRNRGYWRDDGGH